MTHNRWQRLYVETITLHGPWCRDKKNFLQESVASFPWRRGTVDIASAIGTEDPGSNPAIFKKALQSCNPAVLNRFNMYALLLKKINKGIGPKYVVKKSRAPFPYPSRLPTTYIVLLCGYLSLESTLGEKGVYFL
jgi:hypothetical protein